MGWVIQVSDTRMHGDATPHVAVRTGGGWVVSWLPGRVLGYDQAVTAMVLAGTVACHWPRPGDRWWLFVEGWAGELGLTAKDAVALASRPPSPSAQWQPEVPDDGEGQR